MKRVMTPLSLGAMLFVPSTGAAQVTGHVSMSLGFGSSAHINSAHGPLARFGLSSGIGMGFPLHHDQYYDDDYRFGVYEPFWTRPLHCWDLLWYDPFQPCHGYFFVGFPVYDYWSWHSPWRFGFVGWPSHRYVRAHWWSSPFWTHYPSPFWADDYAWGFGRWRWRSGYDRHAQVVRRSPLYGPRYKEYPTPPVYVTDNGPERPVSRAVPRSAGRADRVDPVDSDGYLDRRGTRRTDGARTARPRPGTDVRTARPRTGADIDTSRQGRPRVRARPEPTPRMRIEPPKRQSPKARPAPSSRRPAPIVRSAPSSRRPTPIARPAPSRRPSPTVRSAPSRRPTPRLRSAPSRKPAPKARSTRTRAPAPKARPAPSRAPKPKARPAPRGSGSRKAPPRRPVRRPGA